MQVWNGDFDLVGRLRWIEHVQCCRIEGQRHEFRPCRFPLRFANEIVLIHHSNIGHGGGKSLSADFRWHEWREWIGDRCRFLSRSYISSMIPNKISDRFTSSSTENKSVRSRQPDPLRERDDVFRCDRSIHHSIGTDQWTIDSCQRYFFLSSRSERIDRLFVQDGPVVTMPVRMVGRATWLDTAKTASIIAFVGRTFPEGRVKKWAKVSGRTLLWGQMSDFSSSVGSLSEFVSNVWQQRSIDHGESRQWHSSPLPMQRWIHRNILWSECGTRSVCIESVFQPRPMLFEWRRLSLRLFERIDGKELLNRRNKTTTTTPQEESETNEDIHRVQNPRRGKEQNRTEKNKKNEKKPKGIRCLSSWVNHYRSMSNPTCTRLNEVHLDSLLNDHDTFLFDCDGVLWCAPVILPGAIELLNYLTNSVRTSRDNCLLAIVSFQGKRVFFVTNNSLKTQHGFAQWLNEIGYPAKPVRSDLSPLLPRWRSV